MEINFHLNIGPVGRTPPSKPASRENQKVLDEVALENARALHRELGDTPDVRAELVDRAAILLGDVNYPPRETIQKISHLLALRLYQDDSKA